jgi:preprotein translocase subunit SecY
MKIPELRNRILFTLGMILVFRLGTHIPTPGIDAALLTSKLPVNSELLSFLNMFSGGALKRFSVFALGIAHTSLIYYNAAFGVCNSLL